MVANARDLGLCLRDRRRELQMTQAELASAAGVSRRWLSDLEAGKPTAEIGLVFKAIHALDLMIDVRRPSPRDPNIDLNRLLDDLRNRRD